MLQRVQTLYLLAALALLLSMYFFPLIYFSEQVNVYCYDLLPLLLLSITSMAAVTATIFLYKRRMWQIRISIFNAFILVSFEGWIVYYLYFDRLPGLASSITAAFPMVAAILTVLAIRYIGRDEAMVQSLNRLRK